MRNRLHMGYDSTLFVWQVRKGEGIASDVGGRFRSGGEKEKTEFLSNPGSNLGYSQL